MLTSVEEGRTFSGREGHGFQQTEAFTAEAQAQGPWWAAEAHSPARSRQKGQSKWGGGRDRRSQVMAAELQPTCRYVALTSRGSPAKKGIGVANDFSKETEWTECRAEQGCPA